MSEKRKPIVCGECGREFALKSSLKIHELSHSKKEKPYECTECGRQFTLNSAYRTHILSHAPKSHFECKDCGKEFILKRELIKHVKTHVKKEFDSPFFKDNDSSNEFDKDPLFTRAGEEISKGNICVKFPNKSKFKRLKIKHEQQPFTKTKCLVCKKYFHSEEVLKKHIEQNMYQCRICGESFTSCDEHKTHVLTHSHQCLYCNEIFSSRKERNEHLAHHKDELLCGLCNKKFANHRALHHHVICVHLKPRDVQCDLCGKMYSKQYLPFHMKTHTGERPFSCDICEARFVQRVHLKTHMKIHSGVKEHQCDICGKNFTLRCTLNHHYRLHTGEKPYKCDICSKDFSQMSSMRQHMHVHNPSKPQLCELCGKQYSYKYTLMAHYRDHSSEDLKSLDPVLLDSIWRKCRSRGFVHGKKWECEACGKIFKVKANLLMHAKLHTGEKPHECEICGKRFRLKANLKTHSRVHSGERPYACTVCRKRFVQQSHVKAHMVLHTGGKPHVCDICGKAFGYKNNLIAHRKIHISDPSALPPKKIFDCNVCGKEFNTKSKLTTHRKTCPTQMGSYEVNSNSEFSEHRKESSTELGSYEIVLEENSERVVYVEGTGDSRRILLEEFSLKKEKDIYNIPTIECMPDVPLDSTDEQEKKHLYLRLGENTANSKDDIIVHEIKDLWVEETVHEISMIQ